MSYSDDGSDWDALADRGRPALATAVGAAILLVATLTVRYAAGWQGGTADRLGYAAGGALAIWLVAYLATLRKARPLWKAGSLVALLAVALAAGALRLRPPDATMPLSADAHDTARQLEQLLARPDRLPDRVEPSRGPLSQMSAAILNGALADRHAFDAEAEAAGLNQVISDSPITRSSPVLDRCEALAGLAARAHHYGRRWLVHRDSARRIGEAAVREGRLAAHRLDEFLTGAGDAAGYTRMWALTANRILVAVPLCRILARRRWTLDGDHFRFDNDDDARDYNRHLARLQMLTAALDRINRDARGGARAEIDRMSR